jgi:hypothetical protein
MAEQEIGGQEEKAGVEMPIGERAVTLVAGEGTPNRVNVLLLLLRKIHQSCSSGARGS